MTQDEIIEMARQAGLIVNSPYLMPHDHVMRGIETFAKLVAAKEREACAQICEQFADQDSNPDDILIDYHAHLIRARGNA